MRTVEHARTCLGAVLGSGRRDLLDLAVRHLTPEHFPDATLKAIFQVVCRYADVTGAVVTRSAFTDLLGKALPEGTVLLYAETFDAVVALKPADHEFTWSLKQLQEDRAHEMTGRAVTLGLEHLTGSVSEISPDLELLTPHARARQVIQNGFAEIERDLKLADSPEGDVRREADDIMSDYAERVFLRKSGRLGVLTGLDEIDKNTGAIQPGDLMLLAAWTSTGKTQFSVNLAWEAAVTQGRNVVIATSETVRPQYRRRLIARHSTLPQFGIPDGGLNARDLKAGTLSEIQEQQLKMVVDDLTTNPAYGRLHLAQIPRGGTINMVEGIMRRCQRTWDVELTIIDYLALLRAERKRQSGWEEKSDIIKDAKQIAVTFNDGKGVAMFSPWQISRTAYEQALRSGYYNLSALSESAEAEKTPDIVMTLLRMGEDDNNRRVELKGQLLKVRDGETTSTINLVADFATSKFSAPSSAGGVSALLDD